ncbi:MAG: helix-hairpin-helix domain-containing protein [Chthoniobacterales bacterium]
MPNASNDGDSFHVRASGREYIFRLYFVDTPETDASIPARVADQAKYFGVTVPQTLQIGLEAERFTRAKLTRPFTVVTKKEDARGRSRLPRYFAFIELNGVNLAEDLVANGLARVYGEKAQAPGTRAPAAEKQQLLQLEGRAKAQKLGGWGVGAGRLNARTAATPSASRGPAGDSFEAFFHPPTPTPAPTLSSGRASGGQLDLNTASSASLQSLSGIGPVLAAHIIAARPFQNADELRRVPGIGPAKYAALRPYFR